MLSLSELYNIQINQEKKILEKLSNNTHLLREYIGSFYPKNLLFAIYSLVKKSDLQNSKQYFFICSKIDEYRILRYNARILDFAIPQVNNAILSDNLSFLKGSYANLKYKKNKEIKHGEISNYDMDEMVLDGESTIFCHTIQQFIKNDTRTIERNLNIIETVTLPKKTQSPELMRLDFEYYKALYKKDKGKCEEILEQFVSPKMHKKRNDDPLLSKYVSQPALGYAKLAWMNGLEVETNSNLIPKELLPIKPLDNYEIPYDFLKKVI
jgi:hypothetical protein